MPAGWKSTSCTAADVAVMHRCWRVNVGRARGELENLSTLADLLAPTVTERMRRVGEDPRLAHVLVMARLDPSDQDSWTQDLRPSSEDFGFQRSGAARLTVLLANVAEDASGLNAPPEFIERHLEAVGWARKRIDLCVRGRPVPGLFELLAPRLVDVVAECRPWLVGGWLDHPTALELGRDLTDAAGALGRSRDEVARALASGTGLSVDDVAALLREGLADLGLMLSESDPASVLWIIQD